MEKDKQLLSLINSVKVLNSTRDLDEVLEQLIREVLNVIEGANASVLFLYSKDMDKLYAKSAIGFDMKYLKQVLLEPGEGLSGKTFLSKKAHIFSSEQDTAEGMSDLTSDAAQLYAKAVGGMEYPKSALSVPLISKGECIGVLTVDIFKENVQFDETDLRLLETFADQASIAVENATLFSQNERTKRIHEELFEASLSKGSLIEITKVLAKLVNKKVAVFNEFLDIIAVDDAAAKQLSEELVRSHAEILNHVINQSIISNHLTTIDGTDYRIYLFPIYTDKLNLGLLTIIVEGKSALDPLDRLAVEQASTIFAMEINRRDRMIIEDFSYTSYILEQLIHSTYESFSSDQAKINFPEKADHQYIVAQLYIKDPLVTFQEIGERKMRLFRLINREIATFPYKTLLQDRNMEITMMFTMPSSFDEEQVFQQLEKLFEKIIRLSKKNFQLSLSAGLGQAVDKLKDVRLSYGNARRCVEFLQSTHQEEVILNYHQLGSYRLFLKTERSELTEYVDSVLGTILRYDQDHEADLLLTLKVYLESNQNMAESAKTLFVHVNTVKYRLETVKKILKMKKLTGRKVFEIQLGMYILDYLKEKN